MQVVSGLTVTLGVQLPSEKHFLSSMKAVVGISYPFEGLVGDDVDTIRNMYYCLIDKGLNLMVMRVVCSMDSGWDKVISFTVLHS